MKEALETLGLGPNGGNLEKSRAPEYRRAPLSPCIPSNPDSLHRFETHDTAVPGLKNEQEWHRMAAYMMLANVAIKDIAKAASVTPTEVSFVRSQHWFQELLATLAAKKGDEVLAVIQQEALSSVEKLVHLRDSGVSERIQLAAATTLLEHAKGKAHQTVISSVTHATGDAQQELDNVRASLAALRRRREATPSQSVSVSAPPSSTPVPFQSS